MPRFRLAPASAYVPINCRPFADWMADVTRQVYHRTGDALACNMVPESFWTGLFHCGVASHQAASDFVKDMRNA